MEDNRLSTERDIEKLTEQIRGNPRSLNLRLRRAHLYWSTKQTAQLEAELNLLSACAQGRADYWGLKGLLFSLSGDRALTFQYLTKAIELSESLKYVKLATLYFHRGCVVEDCDALLALNDLGKALLHEEYQETRAICLSIRSNILLRLGYFESARREILMALRLNPLDFIRLQAYRYAHLPLPNDETRRKALEARKIGITDLIAVGGLYREALDRLNQLEEEAGPQIEYASIRIYCLAKLGATEEALWQVRQESTRLAWESGYLYTWSISEDPEWAAKLKKLAPTEREWSSLED